MPRFPTSRPLALRAGRFFSDTVKERGEVYFGQGRVAVAELGETGLLARVRGSGRRSYRVELLWSGAAEGWFGVHCTCPHFSDHDVACKHLWATVLLLDEAGESMRVEGLHSLELYRLTEAGDSSSDGRAASSPVEPLWRQWLDSLERYVPETEESTEAGRRAYFLLDEDQDFIEDNHIRIHFYRRDELQKGGFGKLKANPTSKSELDRFEPEDRRLLSLLLGVGRGDWGGVVGDPYAASSRRRSVSLMPSLFETVLPMLCATGRFGWLSGEVETEIRPVTYDPRPWHLELRGESDGEHTLMRGSYLRQRAGEDGRTISERRDLDEAIVIFAGGEIFFGESIGRLAHSRTYFPFVATLRRNPDLRIPNEEVQTALERLSDLPGQPRLVLPDTLGWPSVEPEPEPLVLVSFDGRRVSAKPAFQYASRRVDAVDPAGSWTEHGARRIVRRSLQAELRRLRELEAHVPGTRAGDGSFELAAEDFPAAVNALRELGWRVEAGGKALRAAAGFSAQVVSGEASGVDWFELAGAMRFEGQEVPLPELLRAAGRGERFIPLDDGSVGILPEQWLERFAPLSKLAPTKGELRFSGHQALLLDALLAAQPEVEVDDAFARLREKLRRFEGLEPASAPVGFEGELRPYQQLGLAWMVWLTELRLGGCLADDMGLGKTIQVLALLEQRRADGSNDGRPSMLVVPRSLLHNWQSEAERFTPALRLHPHHGLGRAARLRQALAEPAAPVIVTTYGTLRRDIAKLKDLELDFAVLDEAQAIKNAASQTAKACRLLPARHRLALTGTPVENHLGELWSLFEFLNPGMLGSLPSTAALAGRQQLPQESLEILATAVRPLVLRRSKSEVLTDLPAKTEQTLYCEMSKKERARYDELLTHYRASLGQKMRTVGLGRSKVMVLEALLRLRQASCHAGLIDPKLENEPSAKLEVLIERLQEIVQEGHKALVFSQFTRLLAIVRQRLEREGLSYAYLDGRTRDRQAKVDQFQDDPHCPLFLISLKAGGVGLNLTAASYVFLLDPWWNPAVEAQAIDRAHRIGQEQPVFAYRLIAKDTVEEKILDLQAEKKALADAIITQDQRFFAKLTADDLALLLGGSLE